MNEIIMSKKVFSKREIEKLIKDDDPSLKFVEKKEHRSQVNYGIFSIRFSSMDISNHLCLATNAKQYCFILHLMVPIVYAHILSHVRKRINQICIVRKLYMTFTSQNNHPYQNESNYPL